MYKYEQISLMTTIWIIVSMTFQTAIYFLIANHGINWYLMHFAILLYLSILFLIWYFQNPRSKIFDIFLSALFVIHVFWFLINMGNAVDLNKAVLLLNIFSVINITTLIVFRNMSENSSQLKPSIQMKEYLMNMSSAEIEFNIVSYKILKILILAWAVLSITGQALLSLFGYIEITNSFEIGFLSLFLLVFVIILMLCFFNVHSNKSIIIFAISSTIYLSGLSSFHGIFSGLYPMIFIVLLIVLHAMLITGLYGCLSKKILLLDSLNKNDDSSANLTLRDE